MTVRIEKLVQGGRGFAHLDSNKSLFVEGALAGELVEVEIDSEKKNYANAHVVEILEPSPLRVVPPCPYWGVCGGCDLQHLNPSEQALLKHQLVLENLQRVGGLDPASFSLEDVASGPAWNYRSRVRFHVDLPKKEIGFLAKKTNTLIPIDYCPVLVDELNEVLHEKQGILDTARQVMFSNASSKNRYIEVPAFAGDSEVSFGDKVVQATVDGHRFFVTANVFFQGNRFLLPTMADFVRDHVLGSVVMDLYSGVGTFSSFLVQEGRKIIAVEKQKQCLALAKRNVNSVQFYTDAVESWGKNQKLQVDTVVVDPPRTGLEDSVPALLASWKPTRVIYISCDSVTLSRDLQRFAQQGYTVRTGKVFDLYPQTSHQEVVIVLDKEER